MLHVLKMFVNKTNKTFSEQYFWQNVGRYQQRDNTINKVDVLRNILRTFAEVPNIVQTFNVK